MNQDRLQVGLLGCGTVGTEVARLLAEDPRLAARFEIAAIVVREPAKPRAVTIDRRLLATNPIAIAARPDVDVVIEVMGGLIPTTDAVTAALSRGAPVVSANKTLFAEHGPWLRDLAVRCGTDVRFEAAVAGAVPVVQILRRLARTDRVVRIEGVLNGTCNFILSEMQRNGATFQDAVAIAQQLGYAEADPTRDLDGSDAADKIAVLAQLAWGSEASFQDVQRLGIDTLTAHDHRHAQDQGRTWRLVAAATETGCLVVEPRLLALDHPFARLTGPENAVTITGEYTGALTLAGPGAGGLATASAILADLDHVATAQPTRAQLAPLA